MYPGKLLPGLAMRKTLARIKNKALLGFTLNYCQVLSGALAGLTGAESGPPACA
jgi:hypothetical protein